MKKLLYALLFFLLPLKVFAVISLDNSVAGTSVSAITCTATLTSTDANDEWIVDYYVLDSTGSPHASTVTSPHLTWTKRVAVPQTTSAEFLDVEEWYAPSTTALTSETVTVTGASSSVTTPTCRTLISAWNGVNMTTPFDVNGVLPVDTLANGAATTATTTISTTNANTVAISLLRSFTAIGTITNPSGYSSVVSGFSSTATALQYQIYSSAQSSTAVTYSWATATANAIMLTDALQASSGVSPVAATKSDAPFFGGIFR